MASGERGRVDEHGGDATLRHRREGAIDDKKRAVEGQ